jgi:hypothetical protein
LLLGKPDNDRQVFAKLFDKSDFLGVEFDLLGDFALKDRMHALSSILPLNRTAALSQGAPLAQRSASGWTIASMRRPAPDA